MSEVTPWLSGMSGSSTLISGPMTAARQAARVQLIGAATCGSVALKSAWMRPLRTVRCRSKAVGPTARGVVLVEVAGVGLAVGQPGERRERSAARVLDRRRHRAPIPVAAVALHEGGNAALRRDRRGDLGLQITPALARQANVGQHEPAHVLIELATPVQPHAAEPKPLLDDVLRGARPAAGGHAADVAPVAPVRRVPEELGVDEDRAAHHHVGLMGAAVVGIVVQDHVAGTEVGVKPAHGGDRELEASRVHADPLVLRDHAALGVEQPAGEILSVAEAGRVRGAGGREHHLADGRDEVGAQDLGLERVEPRAGAGLRAHRAASMPVRTRCPSSEWTVAPGGTSVTVLSSCTRHGPSTGPDSARGSSTATSSPASRSMRSGRATAGPSGRRPTGGTATEAVAVTHTSTTSTGSPSRVPKRRS